MTFRDTERTPALENLIHREAAKLEKVHNNLIRCRIAVEKPHEHQTSGNPYRIRLEILAPKSPEIVVTRDPGDEEMYRSLEAVLRDAFKAARRILKKIVSKQRNEVKSHPQQEASAVVEKLFPKEGYGFLRSVDGQQIYFHRNSVQQDGFDRMEIGTGVNFFKEMGKKGPQASSVRITDKPGSRTTAKK
jgi:cold shock CspA family protein/ribosome-associated translation inhibitor RaiA